MKFTIKNLKIFKTFMAFILNESFSFLYVTCIKYVAMQSNCIHSMCSYSEFKVAMGMVSYDLNR